MFSLTLINFHLEIPHLFFSNSSKCRKKRSMTLLILAEYYLSYLIPISVNTIHDILFIFFLSSEDYYVPICDCLKTLHLKKPPLSQMCIHILYRVSLKPVVYRPFWFSGSLAFKSYLGCYFQMLHTIFPTFPRLHLYKSQISTLQNRSPIDFYSTSVYQNWGLTYQFMSGSGPFASLSNNKYLFFCEILYVEYD